MNLRVLFILIGTACLVPTSWAAPKAPAKTAIIQKPKTLEEQLQLAIKQQNYNLTKSLLQRGAKTQTLGDPTSLWDLVLFQNENDGKFFPDLSFVEWMLKNGVGWNANSLHSVLSLSSPAVFDLFLANGVEINGSYMFFRNESATPIMGYLVGKDGWGDDPAFVRYLIDRGADVNVTTKSGATVLQQVADSNRDDEIVLIKIVLNAGAKPKPTDYQVIECAVNASDDELLKQALELGIKAPKDKGLLQQLCSLETDSGDAQLIPSPELIKNRVECARLLIQADVPVNSFDDEGETPIRCAVADGLQPELVELLLKNGAKPLLRSDPSDQTIWQRAAPLPFMTVWDGGKKQMSPTEKAEQQAIISQESTRTLELLLHAKVPIDLANAGSETILMMCADRNRTKSLKFLLSRGAKLEPRDGYGKTALQRAVSAGSLEATQILIDAKANIETRDDLGNTPLFDSLGSQIFPFLLKKGAKVNVANNDGATPLLMACFGAQDNFWTIDELLKRGANPNVQQKSGETPLVIAILNGNANLARHLVKAGANTKVRYENKSLLQLAKMPSYREIQLTAIAKAPQHKKQALQALAVCKQRRRELIVLLTTKSTTAKKP